MTRSLGFGSKASNSLRPIQTRFRCASAYRLKLARYFKSLTHNTKGTPSPAHPIDSRFHRLPFLKRNLSKKKPANSQQRFEGPAPTVCRYPVSGTVSLPSSGCFSPFPHGTCSLSVAEEYLGLEGGPPVFRQDCTCPALLESPASILFIRGCHPPRPCVAA